MGMGMYGALWNENKNVLIGAADGSMVCTNVANRIFLRTRSPNASLKKLAQDFPVSETKPHQHCHFWSPHGDPSTSSKIIKQPFQVFLDSSFPTSKNLKNQLLQCPPSSPSPPNSASKSSTTSSPPASQHPTPLSHQSTPNSPAPLLAPTHPHRPLTGYRKSACTSTTNASPRVLSRAGSTSSRGMRTRLGGRLGVRGCLRCVRF